MSPLQVTVTPEQQAAMQERLTEAWAPLITSMRVAAPLMAQATATRVPLARLAPGSTLPATVTRLLAATGKRVTVAAFQSSV